MTVILKSYLVADGFDIRVRLDDGRQHTFHSQAGKPADVQKFVDQCEAAMLAAEAEETRIAAIPPEKTLTTATDTEITAEAQKRRLVITAVKL